MGFDVQVNELLVAILQLMESNAAWFNLTIFNK
jgi:hypothetical protein